MEKKNNIMELLHEGNAFSFALVELISADNCMSIEECDKNLEMLHTLLDDLECSENIPEDKKKEYREYIESGINIIQSDKEDIIKTRN